MILGIDLGNFSVKTSEKFSFISKIKEGVSFTEKNNFTLDGVNYSIGEGEFSTDWNKSKKQNLIPMLFYSIAKCSKEDINQVVIGLPIQQYKKDNLFLERKKSKIYNDFIELSNKEKRKADYKEYLNSDHWKEIRLKALSRAGNRCQLCSSTNSLNVHHNTYKNVGNENLKDLVVLCRECHAKFHDKVY